MLAAATLLENRARRRTRIPAGHNWYVWSRLHADLARCRRRTQGGEWLLWVADSTGRCNVLMESFGRGIKVECLARTFIEPPRDGIEFGLRVDREIRAFREVLS